MFIPMLVPTVPASNYPWYYTFYAKPSVQYESAYHQRQYLHNNNNNNNPYSPYRFVYPHRASHNNTNTTAAANTNNNNNNNNSIEHKSTTVEVNASYRVMSYNIMRDDLHENHRSQKYKWKFRERRLLKVILDADSDIVCLQECRDLPQHPIVNFLKQLKVLGYDYSEHFDSNNIRLRVVTLWKRGIFKLLHTRTFWLNSDNVESSTFFTEEAKKLHKTIRPIGFDILIPQVNTNHKTTPIHVWNTHLGHTTAEKNWSVDILPKLMLQYSGANSAAVLCMDANFFDAHSGLEQRKQLCENKQYEMQDLTFKAKFILPHPKFDKYERLGSFCGSSIDIHKPKYHEIGDALDIITAHNCSLLRSWIWNKTMLDTEPPLFENYDDFPSDHLPLVVDLKYNSC